MESDDSDCSPVILGIKYDADVNNDTSDLSADDDENSDAFDYNDEEDDDYKNDDENDVDDEESVVVDEDPNDPIGVVGLDPNDEKVQTRKEAIEVEACISYKELMDGLKGFEVDINNELVLLDARLIGEQFDTRVGPDQKFDLDFFGVSILTCNLNNLLSDFFCFSDIAFDLKDDIAVSYFEELAGRQY